MDKLGQEWVSAAVDSEANEQEIAQLLADEQAQAQWQHYHIIGDAMRDELPQAVALDLSQSIADAIEMEPAHTVDEHSTSVSLNNVEAANDSESTSRSNVVSLFKQFGQYAIAASVALVAVVGVQNYNQMPEGESSPLPVLNTRPLIGSASPVSLQTAPTQVTNQNYSSKQLEEQRRRINAYIQDHMLQQKLNTVVVEQSIHQPQVTEELLEN